MEKIVIKYNSSVMVPAGWRHITIKAEALMVSAKIAEVSKVLEVDGEEPHRYASRTGAKRQSYNAVNISLREIGMRKRLSACEVI